MLQEYNLKLEQQHLILSSCLLMFKLTDAIDIIKNHLSMEQVLELLHKQVLEVQVVIKVEIQQLILKEI